MKRNCLCFWIGQDDNKVKYDELREVAKSSQDQQHAKIQDVKGKVKNHEWEHMMLCLTFFWTFRTRKEPPVLILGQSLSFTTTMITPSCCKFVFAYLLFHLYKVRMLMLTLRSGEGEIIRKPGKACGPCSEKGCVRLCFLCPVYAQNAQNAQGYDLPYSCWYSSTIHVFPISRLRIVTGNVGYFTEPALWVLCRPSIHTSTQTYYSRYSTASNRRQNLVERQLSFAGSCTEYNGACRCFSKLLCTHFRKHRWCCVFCFSTNISAFTLIIYHPCWHCRWSFVWS